MRYWFAPFLLFVLAAGKPKEEEGCTPKCQGEEYKCFDGQCSCADGFIPNYFQTSCVKCPELGQKCSGTCCNPLSNASLDCWHGICQSCHDANGNWRCRETVDQILLITTTQLIMGVALVLGIIATFMLLFKLCAVTNLRPFGNRLGDERSSVGSLQVYVEERLRDAPPRYSASAHPITTVVPSTAYTNDCYIPDGTIPPPPYTEVIKNETPQQNASVHM